MHTKGAHVHTTYILCQHCANIMPTCANIAPTSSQHRTNIVPTLCQHCANIKSRKVVSASFVELKKSLDANTGVGTILAHVLAHVLARCWHINCLKPNFVITYTQTHKTHTHTHTTRHTGDKHAHYSNRHTSLDSNFWVDNQRRCLFGWVGWGTCAQQIKKQNVGTMLAPCWHHVGTTCQPVSKKLGLAEFCA